MRIGMLPHSERQASMPSLAEAHLHLRHDGFAARVAQLSHGGGPARRGPPLWCRQAQTLILVGALAAGDAWAQDVQGVVGEVLNPEVPRAEWRRAPSANAFVIVHWTGHRPRFGHGESVCLQAAIGRTDANGRFEIAEPRPLRSTFMVIRSDPAVAVFKPGFDAPSELRVRGPRPEWTLVPANFTREQRAWIADLLSGLGCRDDAGNLLPLTDPQGVLPAFRDALRVESGAKPAPPIEVRILPRTGPLPAVPSK